MTSSPHDVSASQSILWETTLSHFYSSVSGSCWNRMTISVLWLHHHKHQSATHSLLDADLTDLTPSLTLLRPNHCHSHSCRSLLRQQKAQMKNMSYRCHNPCGSHEESPNHEEVPITRDLSQTIHFLHNNHSVPPETFSLLNECFVRELMTTHYMADAMLCMWSKHLGHGKSWSKSENNMRQRQKDRGRDVNGISGTTALC